MSKTMEELFATITSRQVNPTPNSYTAQLFAAGRTEIAKKVGEEAIEVVVASQSESDSRLISESADLIYHLLVLLAERSIEWRAVEAELSRRRGTLAAR